MLCTKNIKFKLPNEKFLFCKIITTKLKLNGKLNARYLQAFFPHSVLSSFKKCRSNDGGFIIVRGMVKFNADKRENEVKLLFFGRCGSPT